LPAPLTLLRGTLVGNHWFRVMFSTFLGSGHP
jgi:hypothetical protein